MDTFLKQIMDTILQFGGLSFLLKVSSIVTLIVSATKVTFLQKYWEKLGGFQVLVAPILGLVSGVLILASQGTLTWAGVASYVFAGAGAVVLHELLDAIKTLPGIGAVFIAIIDFISGKLGGQPTSPSEPTKPAEPPVQ